VPASDPAGAGMRRHVHPGNHAAESFVSFIPLFDGPLDVASAQPLAADPALNPCTMPQGTRRRLSS